MVSTPVNSHRRSIVSKMTTTSIRVGSEVSRSSSTTSSNSSSTSQHQKPTSLPKIQTKKNSTDGIV